MLLTSSLPAWSARNLPYDVSAKESRISSSRLGEGGVLGWWVGRWLASGWQAVGKGWQKGQWGNGSGRRGKTGGKGRRGQEKDKKREQKQK